VDSTTAAARAVARALGAVRHEVLAFDLRAFGGSAPTADVELPRDRTPEAMAHGIPVTYVPACNKIFLSLALAWAEVLEASDSVIGDERARCQRISRLPAGIHRGVRAACAGWPRRPESRAGRPFASGFRSST
jgi:hypothetical protein